MEPQTPDQTQSVTTLATEPWHAPLCKVTPLSKILAAVVFITLPFVGFWLGMGWGASHDAGMTGVGEVVVPKQAATTTDVSAASESMVKKESKQKIYTAADFKWHFVAQVYKDIDAAIPYGKVILEAGGEQWSLGNYIGCGTAPTLTGLNEGEVTRLVCWYAGGGKELGVFYDEPTGSYVVKERDMNESGGPPSSENPNPPERYGEYKNKLTIDPARILTKTAEQEALYVMALVEAKKLSSNDLEVQLIAGLTALTTKSDVALGLKMSGFLTEYASVRELTNPQVEQLQNQLTNTLGPCWGIPEGNCRE